MNRVLFVSYTSEMRGPSNSLMLLLDGLRDEYELSVLVPAPGPLVDRLKSKGIACHCIGPLTKWRLPRLVALTRRLRPGLVYANATHSSSKLAFIAAWAAGSKFVVHVRAMLWHRGWSSLWYLNAADAVVAVSAATARSVERFVRPGRLEVVHNGVPIHSDDERKGHWEESEHGLPDEVTVLMVAHVCRRKGQLDAVRCLSRLGNSGIKTRLLIAGSLDREPDYVRELLGTIAEHRLESSVELLGYTPDVESLLHRSDILLHTANDDPHPRAVIEAMAAGLPVVAYEVDGVAETVVDGVTGLLAKLGDVDGLAVHLDALVGSEELRRSFGGEGVLRVRSRFTAANTTAGVRSVINRVIGITDGN